jgi:hypothetical protein
VNKNLSEGGLRKMKVLKVSLTGVLLTIAICIFVSCCVKPVEAGSLSNTKISWDQFTSIADINNPVTIDLTGFFDFETDTGNLFSPDGLVYSQVFPGIGSADGFNVYVYQFQVFLGSDVSLTEVSFGFPVNPENFPVDIASSVTSFWVNEQNPSIGIGDASVAPTGATWDNGVLKFTFSNPFQGVSFIVGVFAPKNMPPEETIAKLGTDPANASPTLPLPTVYMPTPEPSVVVCFCLGLVACLIKGGRRSLAGFIGKRRD